VNWISVKERLPERCTSYLVAIKRYGGRYSIQRKQYCKRGWSLKRDEVALGEQVTHWMPLPEPPVPE
jgi:hypothetical protein